MSNTLRGRLLAIAFGTLLGAGLSTVLAQVSGSGVSSVSNSSSVTWSATQTFSQPVTVNGGGSSIKGPVTIPVPSSGTALTVNANSNARAVDISDGTQTLDISTDSSHNYYLGPTGAVALNFQTGSIGTTRMSIGGTGIVTVNAPTSGTAATINGLLGQLAVAATQPVGLPVFTVATLPGCNTTLKGGLAYVTDATTPTYNAALAGGGAVIVPVFCNGTAWTSH